MNAFALRNHAVNDEFTPKNVLSVFPHSHNESGSNHPTSIKTSRQISRIVLQHVPPLETYLYNIQGKKH